MGILSVGLLAGRATALSLCILGAGAEFSVLLLKGLLAEAGALFDFPDGQTPKRRRGGGGFYGIIVYSYFTELRNLP